MGTVPTGGEVADLPPEALIGRDAVVRRPPSVDPLPLVLAAARLGPALVVTPSVAHGARHSPHACGAPAWASQCCPRDWGQARAGAGVTIGARTAVWAPVPDLAVVVVIDEHDEALKEERVPAWHARDVAVERRAGPACPCVLVSPCPTLEALAWGPLVTAEPQRGAAGLAGARGGRHAPGR